MKLNEGDIVTTRVAKRDWQKDRRRPSKKQDGKIRRVEAVAEVVRVSNKTATLKLEESGNIIKRPLTRIFLNGEPVCPVEDQS